MATKFEYTDSPQSDLEDDEFALLVPRGIRGKADILTAIAKAGQFPDYFGSNWDALLDCLRDLSWIGARKVAIRHSDIPLQNNLTECRAYLEILQSALADWSAAKLDTTPRQSEWPYVEHEFRVVFPASDRASVEQLL